MTMSAALGGYGTFVEVDGIFVREVLHVTPPGPAAEVIDITHMQSPDRYREFLSVWMDPGEFSFDMSFVPGSQTDDKIFDMLSSGDERLIRIYYPNNEIREFQARVDKCETFVLLDDSIKATVTMKTAGQRDATISSLLLEDGTELLLEDGTDLRLESSL